MHLIKLKHLTLHFTRLLVHITKMCCRLRKELSPCLFDVLWYSEKETNVNKDNICLILKCYNMTYFI